MTCLARTLFYRFSLRIIFVLVVVASPSFGRAEEGRFYLRNFDYKEYNGHQENWAVVQDHRGIMYFGNNWGVLEYDGVSWRLIQTEKETSVLSLDIDSTGTIYVGLENGFGYLAPDSLGQMRFASLEDHLPEDAPQVTEVWKVHATSQGIYFLTISKLYLWANDSLAVIPITVSALSTVVDDTLYYGEWKQGVMRVVDGKPQLVPGSEKFARVQNYLVIPHPQEQTFLLGHREHGLLIYRGAEFHPFESDVEEYVRENQLYSAVNLPGNRLALGTIRAGVVIIDGQGRLLHKIDKDSGLRNQTVVSMFYDRHGTLWLALVNGIASVELSTPLRRFDAAVGVTSGINALIRHKGVIYAGTNRGVTFLRGEAASESQTTTNLSFQPVDGINSFAWTLYSDGHSLLAGTDKGVYEIKGGRGFWVGYTYRVRGFHRSQKEPNRLYAALQTGLGVLQKEHGRWTYIGKVLGPIKETLTISGDDTDTLWLAELAADLVRVQAIEPMAAPDSLYKYTARISRYNEEHGLPAGQRNVFPIKSRTIFASASGLYQFDELSNTFRSDSTYGLDFTKPDCYIGRVKEDAVGRTWFFARMDRQVMLGAAVPEAYGSFRWHGTPFRRITDIGEVKAIYPEDDGTVWFGGTEAVVKYVPGDQGYETTPFSTLVRRVTVQQDSLIFNGTYATREASQYESPILSYANNAMRFEFAASFYSAVDEIRYQHMLEGFDREWSHWSRETTKDYTNLSEGEYLFKVRARNVYGEIGNEDVFLLTVLPPAYRTWWAYTLYVIAFGVVLFGFAKLQVTRSQRHAALELEREKERAKTREANLRAEAAELHAVATEAEKEKEKERIRTRIAGDLHDEIGSNLSSIAMLSQLLEKNSTLQDRDRRRLRSISDVARQTALSMRDIVWFVNPVNDSLEKLFAKMRETANVMLEPVEFSFQAPNAAMSFEMDLNFRRNLFLVYKEVLQNIVKHAQCRRVEICIKSNENSFELLVEDDGVGFEINETYSGNGLRNFKQRARDMMGEITIESSEGRGTRIELRVDRHESP